MSKNWRDIKYSWTAPVTPSEAEPVKEMLMRKAKSFVESAAKALVEETRQMVEEGVITQEQANKALDRICGKEDS